MPPIERGCSSDRSTGSAFRSGMGASLYEFGFGVLSSFRACRANTAAPYISKNVHRETTVLGACRHATEHAWRLVSVEAAFSDAADSSAVIEGIPGGGSPGLRLRRATHRIRPVRRQKMERRSSMSGSHGQGKSASADQPGFLSDERRPMTPVSQRWNDDYYGWDPY